jgi:hypothetical protein
MLSTRSRAQRHGYRAGNLRGKEPKRVIGARSRCDLLQTSRAAIGPFAFDDVDTRVLRRHDPEANASLQDQRAASARTQKPEALRAKRERRATSKYGGASDRFVARRTRDEAAVT